MEERRMKREPDCMTANAQPLHMTRGQESEPAVGGCGTETRLSVLLNPLLAPRKDLEVRALGHTKTLARD